MLIVSLASLVASGKRGTFAGELRPRPSCAPGGNRPVNPRARFLTERVVIVAKEKRASPSWIDVKAALLAFDRAGLLGLVQDLYTASKENQAFLHARLDLG
jgi:hypothetical protein